MGLERREKLGANVREADESFLIRAWLWATVRTRRGSLSLSEAAVSLEVEEREGSMKGLRMFIAYDCKQCA